MGSNPAITHDRFPKQGTYLNKRVQVCFEFDTAHTVEGMVVRDDTEEPGKLIIMLDDGRYVLSTECQWRPL